MNILQEMAVGEAPPFVPLTVDQYHTLIATGVLQDGDPIELIDGLLVRKDRSARGEDPMTHDPRHASGIRRLQRRLRVVEDKGYFLQSQLPATLTALREPEPDLAVVRGREDNFLKRHPGPKDIAAVMEVSDSSLSFDRTTKQRLYANAEIPIYWIVNLVENQLEVYQEPKPSDGVYARRTDYMPGQTVTLRLETGLEITITVDEILPV